MIYQPLRYDMSKIYENLVKLVTVRSGLEVSEENVSSALELSLSAFNIIPNITYFDFCDEEIIDQLKDPLVTYATYILLVRHAIKLQNTVKYSSNGVELDTADNSFGILLLASELWIQWRKQVNTLKKSESFYDDFVKE